MKTVADAMSSRNNNFDVIRLFAALLVLWSHSYALTAHDSKDIFPKFLLSYGSGSRLAVMIFFVISGFLVTKSASERGTAEYLASRALRILPGLTFVVVSTVFVIAPMMTRLPLIEYLRDSQSLSYLWNVTVFGIQLDIPSATSGLPFPGVINGSIWTLSLECGFYVMIAALFRFDLLTERRAFVPIIAVISLFFYFTYVLGYNWENRGPAIWKGASLYPTARYGSAFILGSAFWIYRNKIVLNSATAVACAIALYAAAGTVSAVAVYCISVPYLVLYFAIGTRATLDIRKVGDLSYGAYLFAFPIQQAIIGLLGPISPTKLSLLATPIVLVIAYFSWWFIEKPFLSLKGPRLSMSRAQGPLALEAEKPA